MEQILPLLCLLVSQQRCAICCLLNSSGCQLCKRATLSHVSQLDTASPYLVFCIHALRKVSVDSIYVVNAIYQPGLTGGPLVLEAECSPCGAAQHNQRSVIFGSTVPASLFLDTSSLWYPRIDLPWAIKSYNALLSGPALKWVCFIVYILLF